MALLPFGEYRPDVSDYKGGHSRTATNVYPRGDGYGPVPSFQSYTQALPAPCRGYFYARKSDGSIVIFAGTVDRLYSLDNTDFSWTPVSQLQTVTITHASPGVISLTAHGFASGDPVIFRTAGSLPSGITAGTKYYVSDASDPDEFTVSATVGGAEINTTTNGSGTHSVTATYAPLIDTTNWQFTQFNSLVIAVHRGVAPQVFNLSTDNAFSDLGGSPPNAGSIAVVNRFLVLSDLLDNPSRIQWSGLNATTTWTPGVNLSDFQDLPDGGRVYGVAGGESGYIFQDSAIRQMVFSAGDPVIFQIQRISEDDGMYAPYSLTKAGDRIFFLSPQGFKMLIPGGYPTPIGKEKIDRTFFSDVDNGNLRLVIGAHDPSSTRVVFAYKSISGQSGLFDKMLSYDWALERWSVQIIMGEYLATLSKPGITLEALDTISSSIDSLPFSLDNFSPATPAKLSGIGSESKLGFFTGPNLEAIIETSEQGSDSRRIFVRNARPVTDADSVYVSISGREEVEDDVALANESALNAQGLCPQRVSTRYARGRMRIPAGTDWTFASGIEPEFTLEGQR